MIQPLLLLAHLLNLMVSPILKGYSKSQEQLVQYVSILLQSFLFQLVVGYFAQELIPFPENRNSLAFMGFQGFKQALKIEAQLTLQNLLAQHCFLFSQAFYIYKKEALYFAYFYGHISFSIYQDSLLGQKSSETLLMDHLPFY